MTQHDHISYDSRKELLVFLLMFICPHLLKEILCVAQCANTSCILVATCFEIVLCIKRPIPKKVRMTFVKMEYPDPIHHVEYKLLE